MINLLKVAIKLCYHFSLKTFHMCWKCSLSNWFICGNDGCNRGYVFSSHCFFVCGKSSMWNVIGKMLRRLCVPNCPSTESALYRIPQERSVQNSKRRTHTNYKHTSLLPLFLSRTKSVECLSQHIFFNVKIMMNYEIRNCLFKKLEMRGADNSSNPAEWNIFSIYFPLRLIVLAYTSPLRRKITGKLSTRRRYLQFVSSKVQTVI